ncbi:MAG: class B sortase [Bacilli bacterium]|nr:class B sortase [Bacilli bacterium]
MKKKRLKIWIVIIFAIICLGLCIYSIYNIVIWKLNVDSNNDINEKVKEYINIDDDGTENYDIDFKSLRIINSEVVGYIKVNGTNIDYPVVQGTNNSYYLKHNLKKEYNIAGWIFADYRNKLDGSDKNLIIYGHNTKDGSMFGSLKNILDSTWQNNKNNLQVILVTEKGQFKYQVFSTYSIEPEDYYINTNFNSDTDYEKFLKTIKNRSNHDYSVSISTNDKILTLSSCMNAGQKRVVLHAKLIEGED